MGTGRLEAFSDGVIAIIITIMVLELKAPSGAGIDALLPTVPVASYGAVLLMAAVAYYILAQVLIRDNGRDSRLAKAIGRDRKGALSIAFYILGIALSCWQAWLGLAAYVLVAIIWVIPDRRIEKS